MGYNFVYHTKNQKLSLIKNKFTIIEEKNNFSNLKSELLPISSEVERSIGLVYHKIYLLFKISPLPTVGRDGFLLHFFILKDFIINQIFSYILFKF